MGPNGKKKMVINHLGKLFVTSDSSTIIQELEVVHPAAKMLVLASSMQDNECGDATNLVVVLGGELLAQAEPLIRMGLHPSDVVSGYKKALVRALEVLETLTCATIADSSSSSSSVAEWRRQEALITQVLQSAVATKQSGYESFIASLVTKACLSILPDVASSDDPNLNTASTLKHFNVDNIRTIKVLGGGVLDSRPVQGFVVARGPEGDVRHVRHAVVAVFATGIDASKTETKGVVRLNTAQELQSFSVGEEQFIERIIGEIVGTGVNVVVSGGAISEMAMHYLERHHVMVVKVQSKFDLRRLCNATRATPLVRLGAPTPEELGRCSNVRTEEIGSTICTIFEQENSTEISSSSSSSMKSQLSTIILRGSTQNILDDVDRAVTDAVHCFKCLTRDPRLVSGAGASEMEISRALRVLGESNTSLEQYAILKFAESLECVPRTLLENSGVSDATHAVATMAAAHQRGQRDAGVNVDTAQVEEKTHVLDTLHAKRSALQLAVDAATTILRIDQLIVSKAAGGPKPPQMGPMDAD